MVDSQIRGALRQMAGPWWVFLIAGLRQHNWTEALLFALGVSVGLTPEMLPMIMTVCLSKGALMMSRKKVIVKHLHAIQNHSASNPCFFNNNKNSLAESIFLWCSFWFRIYRTTLGTCDRLTLHAKYPSCHSNRTPGSGTLGYQSVVF